MTIQEIEGLRACSGATLSICKLALKYKEEHEGVTAMGYIRAKTNAVYYKPTNNPKKDFYFRVKFNSKKDDLY